MRTPTEKQRIFFWQSSRPAFPEIKNFVELPALSSKTTIFRPSTKNPLAPQLLTIDHSLITYLGVLGNHLVVKGLLLTSLVASLQLLGNLVSLSLKSGGGDEALDLGGLGELLASWKMNSVIILSLS